MRNRKNAHRPPGIKLSGVECGHYSLTKDYRGCIVGILGLLMTSVGSKKRVWFCGESISFTPPCGLLLLVSSGPFLLASGTKRGRDPPTAEHAIKET